MYYMQLGMRNPVANSKECLPPQIILAVIYLPQQTGTQPHWIYAE